MFALASEHITDKEEKERALQIGADVTSTCHESYARSGIYWLWSMTCHFCTHTVHIPYQLYEKILLHVKSSILLLILATHIGPDSFSFGSNEAQAVIGGNRVYLMRPEVVESYFVLWRVTHDNKYREWAWDAIQVCVLQAPILTAHTHHTTHKTLLYCNTHTHTPHTNFVVL